MKKNYDQLTEPEKKLLYAVCEMVRSQMWAEFLSLWDEAAAERNFPPGRRAMIMGVLGEKGLRELNFSQSKHSLRNQALDMARRVYRQVMER